MLSTDGSQVRKLRIQTDKPKDYYNPWPPTCLGLTTSDKQRALHKYNRVSYSSPP